MKYAWLQPVELIAIGLRHRPSLLSYAILHPVKLELKLDLTGTVLVLLDRYPHTVLDSSRVHAIPIRDDGHIGFIWHGGWPPSVLKVNALAAQRRLVRGGQHKGIALVGARSAFPF